VNQTLTPKRHTDEDALFKPALEWCAILLFVMMSALLILVGNRQLLNLLFPLQALILSIFLYSRHKILYNGLVWWLWILTPLVRRLADFYSNYYTEPSPLLIAPFLATLVSALAILKPSSKNMKFGNTAYLLVISSLVYGFFIGLVGRDPANLILRSLDYFSPVVYSLYIFSNWRDYPKFRKNTLRVFLWMVLVMGVYGVIQFVIVPQWDAFWLIKSEFASGGKPVPFLINVWSTMQSNRPFGTVMGAGLVLLLINEQQGALGLPATIFGYLSFLLARKRITWISWLIAVILLGNSLAAKRKIKLVLTLGFFAGILYFIITLSPLHDFLSDRFSTLSNLETDHSATVRQATFENTIGKALTSLTGSGLGGPSYDNGIISGLLDLGWIGALPYILGISLIFLKIFRTHLLDGDTFAIAARSIALSTASQLPFGRPHIEVQGMILWGFLGFSMAAINYHKWQKHQTTLEARRSHLVEQLQ